MGLLGREGQPTSLIEIGARDGNELESQGILVAADSGVDAQIQGFEEAEGVVLNLNPAISVEEF